MANEAWQSAFVEVVPDFSNFRGSANREMTGILGPAGDTAGRDSSTRFGGSFVSGIGKFAVPIAGAIAALGIGNLIGDAISKGIDFAVDSIDVASSLNEQANAVAVAFGDASDEIVALSEGSLERLNLSELSFDKIAVQFSNFAKSIAGDGGDVADVVDQITQRGADFASVYDIDVNDALSLFQSGLAGETEPLRKYGIDLSAAAVSAYAYANGIAEAGSQLTEQQRVQAAYGALLAQTAITQGDLANTSGSLANQQRLYNESIVEAQAAFGQYLLPAVTSLITLANEELIPTLGQVIEQVGPLLGDALTKAAPSIGELVTALVPLIPEIVRLATEGLPPLVELLIVLSPFLIDAATNTASLTSVFSSLFGLISGDASLDETTQKFFSMGGSVFEAGRAVGTFVGEAIGNLNNFASSVGASIGTAVGFVSSLPQQAASALSGFAGQFFSAGSRIVENFAAGIRSALGAVGAAMGSVMDFAASFLPHSPAQRGQFSGTGWSDVLSAGTALGDQFGLGLQKSTANIGLGDFSPRATVPGLRPTGMSLSREVQTGPSDRPIYMDGNLFGILREVAGAEAQIILAAYDSSRSATRGAGYRLEA